MHRITVIIPTRRRPDALRRALSSVFNQVARELIEEVIISENSTDRRSLEVVQQFTGLPVRHVFQDPQVSFEGHFATLAARARSEWVAGLADDDLWGRHHLSEAARGLQTYPDAIAFIGRNIGFSDRRGDMHVLGLAFPGIRDLSATESGEDFALLGPCDMAAACLLATPLNLWAVVVRRSNLLEAVRAFSDPKPGVDADRYFMWRLGAQGKVVVGREITLFSQYHAESTAVQYLKENREFHQRMAWQYSRRILAESSAAGLDVRTRWVEWVEGLTEAERKWMWDHRQPWPVEALREAWPGVIEKYWPEKRRCAKDILRDWSPPAIWELASKLRLRSSRR
jgi:glycosyltransferase involved in cell wall biosynthesis